MVHSKMALEERGERIQAFENGAFDAIIHVGILGEGYDHPPLSVAAIFRPFRTLAPYAQFIGRTLRRIANGTAEDNVAHVVAHTGLNLDPLWSYFKEETIQAAILQEIEELEEEEESAAEIERKKGESLEDPTVTFEEIARFDVDTFLPARGADPARLEQILALAQQALLPLEKEGIPVPNLRELIRRSRTRLEEQPVVVPVVRPDLERHEYRKLLAGQVQKAAGRVALELDLGPGRELVTLLGRGDERNNYQVVIRLLNHALNRRLGKPESGSDRLLWTLTEIQRALRELDHVAGEVGAEIRPAIQWRSDEGKISIPGR
jgi:DNA repair protein RadD